MIEPMARLRPPAWFTDPAALEVMRALYCLHLRPELGLDDLERTLELHGTLQAVGGRAGLEAMTLPSPFLEIARATLRAERAALPAVDLDWRVRLAGVLLEASTASPEDYCWGVCGADDSAL